MIKKEYPILEFDNDRNAIIRPSDFHKPIDDMPEKCVFCFFPEIIEKFIQEYPNRIIEYFKTESIKIPIYELDYNGKKIALMQAGVGAPIAGGQLDELVAMGCKKIMVCGSCGVLDREIVVGHLIIPISAVRDEGTSYHYIKPSREIEMDSRIVEKIEKILKEHNVSYIKGKTWTTDAFFRETPNKVQLRKEEGCIVVEMETSAYLAVAKYNNIDFGQILYAGDNLDGDMWDKRDWHDKTEVRKYLLQLAIEICLKL